jgi:FdhD protein
LNTTLNYQLIHWDTASRRDKHKALIGEEPLSIRVQGNPYSVVMRTPGDEIALVAGFCLTEGIIDSAGPKKLPGPASPSFSPYRVPPL